MSAEPITSQRWLHGPGADLLLGCGGVYLLFVLALLLPATQQALAGWLGFGAILVGLLTNTPHYGATLLRVYEHRADRRRYALFAVHATLLLGLLFVAGLRSVWLGSLLISAYATWSPWHFAGQNYGLALMFLRRRGVAVDAGAKRLLYVSFLLSFALTFLTLHGDLGALELAPIPTITWGVFDFVSLNLPAALTRIGLPLLSAAYLGVLAGAGWRLRRAAPRDLAPAALLVALQALWFSVPAMLRVGGRYTSENIALSTLWIAIAHSIQYLWVTSYYAKRSGDAGRLLPYLGRTLLAGAAVTVLPALFFAPRLIGNLPYHSGMAMLLFAVVNLHHFVLDGAIWKLRDGSVARVLLRSPAAAAPAGPLEAAGRGGRWLRPLFWAVGAVCLVVAFVGAFEMDFGYHRAMAARDFGRVEQAAERLAWIGRAHQGIYNNLAVEMARDLEGRGARPEEWQPVLAHYRRSLAIRPTPQAWAGIGTAYEQLGEYEQAVQAFESALALDPEHVISLAHLGPIWIKRGELERASELLERARRLAPDDPGVQAALASLTRARRQQQQPTRGAATAGPAARLAGGL